MNHLNPVLQLDLSVLFTALSWVIGVYVATRRVLLFQCLAVGSFVVLAGYTEIGLNLPAWLAVPVLIPLDIFLAWYMLRKPRHIAVAYLSSWVAYAAFHIVLSACCRFDWLIPAWKLHA